MHTRRGRALVAAMAWAAILLPGWNGYAGEAPIDVSNVKPENCRRCGSTGRVRCPECHGRGFSFNAKIPCPKCEGKRRVDCKECNPDGLVRCGKCKKRTIDGKRVYAILNPEWDEWNKKYGKKVAGAFNRSRLKDVPPEPEKYVVCPDCNGEGMLRCPVCNGTKHRVCPKCKGEGFIRGRGPCPVCKGTKYVACPECASLEGVPKKTVAALESLLQKKLISEEEYYKRRRILTAQEKYRRELLAKREAGAKEEKEPAKTGGDAGAGSGEAAGRKEMQTLTTAYAAQALSFAQYRRKVRELGLAPDTVRSVETAAGKGNPKIHKYVELKEKFRKGEIDVEQYREALKEL